jgi:hypothetical protein
VPTWLTNEEGQKLQKGIWDELVSRLESVQPGPISKLKYNLCIFSPSRTTIPDMHSKRLEVCYSNINVHFHDDSRNEVSLLPRRTSSHRR